MVQTDTTEAVELLNSNATTALAAQRLFTNGLSQTRFRSAIATHAARTKIVTRASPVTWSASTKQKLQKLVPFV
jgi:hypothetical protein